MRIGVFGLGNVLRRDDGFGPAAARWLEASWAFPEDVTVADLGTPGLDLAAHLIGHDAVLVLDTVTGDGPPGAIRVLDRDDLMRAPEGSRTKGPSVTQHEADLRDALWAAALEGRGPRTVVLVGVIPRDLSEGTGFSAEVAAARDRVIEVALRVLAGWGVRAAPRAHPGDPGAWWTAA